MKTKDRVAYYISIATLVIAITILVYFSYLMFFPFKVCYNFPDNYQVTKSQYRTGEILTYRVHYIKYGNYPATVIRSFVDGLQFTLPTIQTNHPMGEHSFISGTTTVPECLPPGKYYYQATVIYKVNPFREIIRYMKSNSFNIVADDTKKNVK
jgi:hypothetical protein